MKTTILAVLLLLAIAVEAKPKRGKSIHWQSNRSTVSGRHNVFIPNWGGNSYCATYKPHFIKPENYKRYKNFRFGQTKRK